LNLSGCRPLSQRKFRKLGCYLTVSPDTNSTDVYRIHQWRTSLVKITPAAKRRTNEDHLVSRGYGSRKRPEAPRGRHNCFENTSCRLEGLLQRSNFVSRRKQVTRRHRFPPCAGERSSPPIKEPSLAERL